MRLELDWRRAQLEPSHAPCRLLQRDVADGPDVGPAERREEVDVGRPRPDPGKRDERRADAVVVEGRHGEEIERAVLDRRRERTNVPGLLPAEPVGAQLGVARAEDPGRREPAESLLEPVVRSPRRGERDLLLEDQQDERLEPGLARPELG